MNGSSFVPRLVGALCLVAVGATIGYSLRPSAPARTPTPDAAAEHPAAAPHDHAAAASPTGAAGDVIVTLTPDMAARAHVRAVSATEGTLDAQLRLPGVVEPNAYKEIAVTSLVSGRVTQVQAELGQQVNAQDPLVTIYSPELADAQTAFIAARAQQAAHGQRQTRLQRLTAIGAATREELETVEAERVMHDSNVETARARLALLGIPEERTQRLAGPQDVVTTTTLRAPLAGVVTRRAANVGMNIDPTMALVTIVDLSSVWVQADLYERDFAKVRVGSPAAITSASYPGMTIRGRVSYIDPQVKPETRTARLRVEVPNPSGRLRLGMYVDALVGEAQGQRGVFVPRASVQLIGSDQVVYLATRGQPGRFVERKVRVGETRGNDVLVVSGLEPGDEVVTDGVFFVRAERERTVGRAP